MAAKPEVERPRIEQDRPADNERVALEKALAGGCGSRVTRALHQSLRGSRGPEAGHLRGIGYNKDTNPFSSASRFLDAPLTGGCHDQAQPLDRGPHRLIDGRGRGRRRLSGDPRTNPPSSAPCGARHAAARSVPEGPVAASPAPVAFGSAWEFLYTGDHPLQIGVQKDAIDPRRAAVLHGRATTRDGDPVSGATVTVERHPEFGVTQSGEDGSFALAVNGGGRLCVRCRKEGFLPVCRQAAVPWRDHAWLPDVALVPVDGAVSAIDLADPAPVHVARGSVVKDDDGERRGTLFLPQGETAELILADGKKEPVSALHVHLTEYTVGKRGPAAMPAPLPANSAYTYAFELTADEATAKGVRANGKELLLSKPAIFYVENFLNFPAGIPVPMGYFDESRGAWAPSDSGRVVKVLAVKDGLAELDVDGDDKPAGADALAKLGITDAELRQLAALYKPGQGLWRVAAPHFSTYDSNWGFSPPQDAQPPNGSGDADDNDGNPCDTPGSMIEIQNQVLGESVGLVGAPAYLQYQSRRVPGRTATRTLTIHLSGGSIPKSLKRIELEVLIAGQRFSRTDFPAEPNQAYTFVWDGKDGQGRAAAVSQLATVRHRLRLRRRL